MLGVRRFIAEHGPWSVFVEARSLDSMAPPWLKNWKGDGILTRSGSQRMLDAVTQCNVPTVELRSIQLKHNFPFVGVDNRLLGRKVAEHFLDRGFRHFGVYQLDNEDYFKQRCDVFVQTLSMAGHKVEIYRAQRHPEHPVKWERQQDRLVQWITQLPKPVGLMASNDQLGFWLLDACSRAGFAVPEHVAVVGVENDETLCSMSRPPLSSVPFNSELTGYEAASLLSRMMNGQAAPKKPILIPPLEMVTRQSSDVVAIDDQKIAAALGYIRQHACEGIDVSDVLRAVPISRTSLERRMRLLIGRSPKAEISRIRIKTVRTLLAESDLTLSEIAERTGFSYPQHMCSSFHREFGQTPGQYRRQTKKAPFLNVD